MTKELKRCPFCNQKASVLTEREDYRVVCGYCAASTGCFETEKEAVAAWNARPIEDTQKAENKRLREALEHAVTTDTTVDKWGIWRIDGKTFQTWAADVLKGNEK